jgi:hypothetical protein
MRSKQLLMKDSQVSLLCNSNSLQVIRCPYALTHSLTSTWFVRNAYQYVELYTSEKEANVRK